VGYEWSFSDGTKLTGKKVDKKFSQQGNYSATLKVTGTAFNKQYTDTESISFKVGNGLNAIIKSPKSGTYYKDQTLSFNDASLYFYSPISKWTVYWGDGSKDESTVKPTKLNHKYSGTSTCVSAGKCEFKLVVTDAAGAISEDKSTLTFSEKPLTCNAFITDETSGIKPPEDDTHFQDTFNNEKSDENMYKDMFNDNKASDNLNNAMGGGIRSMSMFGIGLIILFLITLIGGIGYFVWRRQGGQPDFSIITDKFKQTTEPIQTEQPQLETTQQEEPEKLSLEDSAKDYISKAKAAGLSNEQIKQKMITAGWSPKDVETYLAENI